jgi:hypothetical protein
MRGHALMAAMCQLSIQLRDTLLNLGKEKPSRLLQLQQEPAESQQIPEDQR